ncbi:hypothetical protein TSTA_113030 [Talaromyces stipitatus ATCC 10500]|uniref:Uncharacterized protein n=1 Tax=Talaromyces stipitatus (strain ATCC 10500 / CBS 375.48 / QM 6759 / NRRL 1006) TaxID=441959 RepID=B8MCV1_TALSN|nr:uncharacterized protein TSTA_113030 [Talaromyces stipitatus ATCC 10500]EED17477.1 hypothetical protein TSTA_113030 [Talaromyces stipitatus ATCC 10500]
MGLIRDVLGSAMGADQVKNGFNDRGRHSRTQSGSPQYPPALPPRSSGYDYRDSQRSYQQDDYRYDSDDYDSRQPYMNFVQDRDPRPYSVQQGPQGYNNSYNVQDLGYSRGALDGFRPFALPQITYGDGQPFLRGYSDELQLYNISFNQFMQALDAINVAIIPNPEAQIFQKGANIAGWVPVSSVLLPGAASIGLTVGQIGVGIGTAMGHSSAIAKVMSKANLELFVPNGLEICIGKSKDVDTEVGISSNGGAGLGAQPEDRAAFYGNHLAPLTNVLPPLQNSGGRSNPLAMLSQQFSDKDNDKKIRKTQEKLAKGKADKYNALERSLQCVGHFLKTKI